MVEDAASTAPFWDALADGRFLLRECADCGHRYFPPAPVCPDCHGTDVAWTEVDPVGDLYAFTRQHRTAPGFDSPVVLGTVDLDAGPRLLVRLDDDYAACELGARIELRAVDYEGGLDRGRLADAPFFRGFVR